MVQSRSSTPLNAPYTRFPYPVNGRTVDLVFQMNEAGMSKLDADWLEQLKGWMQSGQWLEREHPDGRAARLDTVLVGLDYHIGLLYKLTAEEVYFQIFLNPDGTEQEELFWSSEESGEPELYTEEEMSAVEQHIQKTFGTFERVFHELVSPDIHVDICMVPPVEGRDYYTLVTMGMGAHRMNVPKDWQNTSWNGQNLPSPCRRTGSWIKNPWRRNAGTGRFDSSRCWHACRLPTIPGWDGDTPWTTSPPLRRIPNFAPAS